MYVQIGQFKHPPGTVEYSLRFDPILNEAEYPLATKARVELKGKIIQNTAVDSADGQALIAAQIQQIVQAYVSGQDLLLVQDDGQLSPNSFINSKTLGGVRVIKPPEFPAGDGTQYVTQLDWTVVLEAEVPFAAAVGALWSWEEAVETKGTGGPRIGVIEPLRGSPVMQTLKQSTAVYLRQTGTAVGYLAYPTPPPPVYPALEIQSERTITPRAARAIGKGKDRDYKLFPLSWSFLFVSPRPIAAAPTQWPLNN